MAARSARVQAILDEGYALIAELAARDPLIPSSDMEDDVEIGSCQWGSGAYGIAGTIHVARPRDESGMPTSEPAEECCTFG